MPILLNQATTVRPWAFTEVFKLTPTSGDGKTIRNADYKLIKFDNGTEKFFNLTNSPLETAARDLLTGTLTTTQITNYNYLCTEMTSLVRGSSFCNALGVNNVETQINVSPNPFHNFISIKSGSGNENYKLYSNLGQLIYDGTAIENQDFSSLANGIYFLKIMDKSASTIKLIKE